MITVSVRSGGDAPCNVNIEANDERRRLTQLLAGHGFPLNTRCGERGLCRGCEIVLQQGTVTTEGMETTAPAVVRACQSQLCGSIAIEIPTRSLMEHRPQVGESFSIGIPIGHQPLFPPVPGKCDTGFAVDIGTTTVVVLLIDLVSGEVLSRAGGFNAQIRFGDNVLTRIAAAGDPSARREMQSAVVADTIAPLLTAACERADRSLSRLAGGTVAGNTTMLHLLLGEDPTALGVSPFAPRFVDARRTIGAAIGFPVSGNVHLGEMPIQLLPSVSGYIGADIVAGIYATGMLYADKPTLLVDMGTNGEVVLKTGRALFACATAAGPAFEGCGLTDGTRAREGAIGSVRSECDPFRILTEVIGQTDPIRANGVCGSAYVDFLAEGRRVGLLTASGRFENEAWEHLPIAHRFQNGTERAVLLVAGSMGAAPRISEADIALLLQAKAAIGAGIETLLEAAGLQASELDRVYLAGGFGMYLNVRNAIAIGLLPGIHPDQVEVIGNSSLAGALLALIDGSTLNEMESIRESVNVLELNLQDDFEDRYIDHLLLP